eukprot:6593710-Prymnesium_polylepis.1
MKLSAERVRRRQRGRRTMVNALAERNESPVNPTTSRVASQRTTTPGAITATRPGTCGCAGLLQLRYLPELRDGRAGGAPDGQERPGCGEQAAPHEVELDSSTQKRRARRPSGQEHRLPA